MRALGRPHGCSMGRALERTAARPIGSSLGRTIWIALRSSIGGQQGSSIVTASGIRESNREMTS